MRNLFKSKSAMSLLLIGLAAIIIGGATMAWFTDDADVANATFTAGTVEVSATGPNNSAELNKHLNVNPGDCGVLTWNIVNDGSKTARLRVHLTEDWSYDAPADLPDNREATTLDETNPFYFLQPDNSDWVMYDPTPNTNDGVWLYYKGDVEGTFNSETGTRIKPKTSVELKLVYAFDGSEMDNRYQNAGLTLGGTVEAIQASHDASLADAKWKEGWEAISAAGYGVGGANLQGEAWTNWEYFHTGEGQNSDCWKKHGNATPPIAKNEVVASTNPAGIAVIAVDNPYEAGETVTLTAPSVEGYTFTGWSHRSGLEIISKDGNAISFKMPAFGVEVRANYQKNAPDYYKIALVADDPDLSDYYRIKTASTVEIVKGSATQNEPGDDITVKANPGKYQKKDRDIFQGWHWDTYDLKFDKWVDDEGKTVSTDPSYSFDMPANDVNLTAMFSKLK